MKKPKEQITLGYKRALCGNPAPHTQTSVWVWGCGFASLDYSRFAFFTKL